MIYQEIVKVKYNHEIASGYWETEFESELISTESHPGQFINILPEKNWTNVMRRPMSVSHQEEGILRIINKVVGPGTQLMSNWKRGDTVDIIGALGNYWENWENYHPVLIGGGVGIAPILNLHNHLRKLMVDHTLIMGARTKNEHFLIHEPENQIYLTTDDGSLGIHGNVLKAFNRVNYAENLKIFSCGPAVMMEGVKTLAFEKNIPCDFALERIMACGFGICQGCTVERVNNDEISSGYRKRFALACMDGPIFSAEDIISC